MVEVEILIECSLFIVEHECQDKPWVDLAVAGQ
jgi:hypothetical protein